MSAPERERHDPVDTGQAHAGGRPPARPWRWLVVDLALLVVLGGAAAGAVALSHGGATRVSSRSAVVARPAQVISAPVAGTVTGAPGVTGSAVRRGQVLFRIAAVTGGQASVPAPVSGSLASLAAVPGATVAAGQTLATVVPDGRMEVVAMVSEDAIRRVRVGQQATITLPVDPGVTLHGRVLAVWPQTAQAYIGQSGIPTPPAQEFLKQTALVPVAVSLDRTPRSLATGESAEVTIDVGQ